MKVRESQKNLKKSEKTIDISVKAVYIIIKLALKAHEC